MKLLPLACILLSLLQAGCLSTIALVNGADASISRKAQPDPGLYTIRLVYDGREPIIVNLRCERYYDAQASTRGNFWAWREVGTESQYQAKVIVVVDERLGTIKFSMPTCGELKSGDWKGGPLLVIHLGETPYFYVRSKNDAYIYKPQGRVPESSYIDLRYRLEIAYVSESNSERSDSPPRESGRGLNKPVE